MQTKAVDCRMVRRGITFFFDQAIRRLAVCSWSVTVRDSAKIEWDPHPRERQHASIVPRRDCTYQYQHVLV
jgi:hypothetical protein